MKEQLINILKNIIPFIIAFFLPLITLNEIILTFVMIFLLAFTMKMDYVKREWELVLIGIVVGFIIEVVTGLIYRLQYWSNGSLFGVPFWVPIMWGYSFLVMRRVGDNIVVIKNKRKN